MKRILVLLTIIIFFSNSLFSENIFTVPDTVCSHVFIRDKEGMTLAWYKPDVPGAAYDHVINLASGFLKDHCPIDKKTGFPFYLIFPEWAPTDRDHVLRSASVVQKIKYSPTEINRVTFDNISEITIRLVAKPKSVQVNGIPLQELSKTDREGFVWTSLYNGGVLRISYKSGNKVTILK